MNSLSIFADNRIAAANIRGQLTNIFKLQFHSLERLQDILPEQYLVFDIDMHDGHHLLELKEWLRRKPKNGKVVFAVDKSSRREITQAHALGATDVIQRPINGEDLLKILWGDFSSLALDTEHPPLRSVPVIGPAFNALENVFSSACLGGPLDLQKVHSAGKMLVDCIETQGLGWWIGSVRKHHSQTYQHSLLVTGVAVAFGQSLGISAQDRQRLSFAGMLHDIGKARIPISILEKPGPLNEDEMTIIRKHPEYGLDALKSVPDIQQDMLDMVVHHHEYLDGSGYPHGLQANEISDFVRIMTISDIFAALIERRSYKAPMSGEDAYQILVDMGPKLDNELVREFRFASGLKVVISSVTPDKRSVPSKAMRA